MLMLLQEMNGRVLGMICKLYFSERQQIIIYRRIVWANYQSYLILEKTVEEQLIQVGINTPDELRAVGAKTAWLKIQEIDESACINRLMALEGAIQGIKKTILDEEVKADLKEFYQWKKK